MFKSTLVKCRSGKKPRIALKIGIENNVVMTNLVPTIIGIEIEIRHHHRKIVNSREYLYI